MVTYTHMYIHRKYANNGLLTLQLSLTYSHTDFYEQIQRWQGSLYYMGLVCIHSFAIIVTISMQKFQQ